MFKKVCLTIYPAAAFIGFSILLFGMRHWFPETRFLSFFNTRLGAISVLFPTFLLFLLGLYLFYDQKEYYLYLVIQNKYYLYPKKQKFNGFCFFCFSNF